MTKSKKGMEWKNESEYAVPNKEKQQKDRKI